MKKIYKLFVIIFLTIPFGVFAADDYTTPGAPINVNAVYNSNEILVTWDPPVDDGGIAVEGYIIYFGPKGLYFDQYQVTQEFNEYIIKQVRSGGSYEIYITAFNWKGEGQPSSTITVSSVEPDELPVILDGVRVSGITASSAEISWETNISTTSSVYYDVHKEDQHGFISSIENNTSHVLYLTELLKCTKYFFVTAGVS